MRPKCLIDVKQIGPGQTLKEEYDYMPSSHKITKSGLVNGRDGRKAGSAGP